MVEKGKSGSFIEDAQVKQIELDVLKQLAAYCDAHNLRYYLAYGTLLGAVRHQGFIPWDNDVDIYMPRPDYENLRKLVREESVADYIDILDYRYCDTFPFLKACDNRTVLREEFLVTENTAGVYVDIFPLDGYPTDPRKAEFLRRKRNLLAFLCTMSSYRFNTGSNTAVRMVKNLLYPFSKLLPKKAIMKKMDALCASYDYEQCEYVSDLIWGYRKPYVIPRRLFNDTCMLPFEDGEFCAPLAWDAILRGNYGEYMELPPIEERFTHAFDARWK